MNAIANMVGGTTTLGLLITSDHLAKAGVIADVVNVLVQAGAKE